MDLDDVSMIMTDHMIISIICPHEISRLAGQPNEWKVPKSIQKAAKKVIQVEIPFTSTLPAVLKVNFSSRYSMVKEIRWNLEIYTIYN